MTDGHIDSLIADLEKSKQPQKCSVTLCANEAKAVGLCDKHYQRQRRHGTTADPEYHSTTGANVSFRCSPALKARVAATARKLKLQPSDVWRGAAEEFTGQHEDGTP